MPSSSSTMQAWEWAMVKRSRLITPHVSKQKLGCLLSKIGSEECSYKWLTGHVQTHVGHQINKNRTSHPRLRTYFALTCSSFVIFIP
uniref:Uncharacterized protein n=1 Tax=Anguilla anguilla TaxID=7936 RepID=A0A0E9PGW1_ANGAN